MHWRRIHRRNVTLLICAAVLIGALIWLTSGMQPLIQELAKAKENLATYQENLSSAKIRNQKQFDADAKSLLIWTKPTEKYLLMNSPQNQMVYVWQQ